jgi:hypothetical protein
MNSDGRCLNEGTGKMCEPGTIICKSGHRLVCEGGKWQPPGGTFPRCTEPDWTILELPPETAAEILPPTSDE